jgi:hypothetical protein
LENTQVASNTFPRDQAQLYAQEVAYQVQ